MKLLHIDPFAGISGDMTVSALRDLGVPEEVFQEALASLPITLPECRFVRGERGGISGWRFRVKGHDGEEGHAAGHHHHDDPHDHAHDHSHGDSHGHNHSHGHGHSPSHSHSNSHSHSHHHGDSHTHGRTHDEIRTLLGQSRLPEEVKQRAISVFQRIAIAEGGIHGVPPETVGFHEVGAEDSIADIVAACAGFAHLKLDRITCGSLIEGTGHIHCAHGTFPLPAPATLALLKGIPFRQVEEPWEHITPTGAALVAEFATSFGAMPEASVSAIGYGLGSRHTPNRPNALRLILGESIDSGATDCDEIVELRCNLDDLTPEHAAHALEAILTAGALDATLTPTVMKKGRSGWILEVLCHEEKAGELSAKILRETTAFGVRRHRMDRLKLERHHRSLSTPYGEIAVKVGTLRGEILQQSPEFSSCAEAAARHGVPVRLVHQAALQAIGSDHSQ
ncbi:MAG: nickel pincer cofactor biosynthesis protein LarC [Chthoniobacterales bacterium]